MKDWPFVERWVPFLYTFWGRGGWYLFWSLLVAACVEIKIYGAFVLNHRVVLHAIDATPARWRCRFLAARPSQDGRVVAEK